MTLVRCEVVGGVATVTLDDHEHRNALSTALLGDLHLALDRALAADVRVVVLTNAGTTFSAGADLRERRAGPVDSTPMVRAFSRLMHARQPTIAAVRGNVRAGGVGLMASCDLVVVPTDTTFAFTEVRLGLVPAIIAVPIMRRCSAAQLAAPFLTGQPFGSAQALSLGLVTHVVDDVGAEVDALCEGLLAAAPGALAITKAILGDDPMEDVDARLTRMQRISDDMFRGPEGVEGMRSFFDKDAPSWARRDG